MFTAWHDGLRNEAIWEAVVRRSVPKGILVDEKIAVVGSQNWSPDGTQYNASLIPHSPQIAKYFARVFEFESGPTPPWMVRIPWTAWYDAA